MTKKLYRAVPWLGGIIALMALRSAVRHKGLMRGSLDTVLDFTPGVGTVKNLMEVVRGRDFIGAKTAYTAAPR